MSAARLTTVRLRQFAAELPDRYTAPLVHLSRARVLTGHQLDRLLSEPDLSPENAGRVRRRIMARLGGLGLVATMERRVGGVRAGSAGHVHVLTAAGHKLAALLAGVRTSGRVRHSRAPGPMFVNHAVDIAEIYVQLTETSRASDFLVTAFATEPATWWPIRDGGHLRPDAYTLLELPTHRDCWWLEIDRNTESPARLRNKCGDYIDHATHGGTGPHGALPGVLFTAPDEKRAESIRSAIASMSGSDAAMFTVTTHHQAARLLIAELHATPPGSPAGQVEP